MNTFDRIYQLAVARKGKDALEARLPVALSSDDLAELPDAAYLSAMARCLFQAGFSWRVVDAKWDAFEIAFRGFEPEVVAAMNSNDLRLLVQDERVIRNAAKLSAVVENARFIRQRAEVVGSFARFVAEWPEDDVVGLWAVLRTEGSRLGGDTGPRFLRSMGKDTFVLTPDVVTALIREGVVAKKPTSKGDIAAVQIAFNTWSKQSGRSRGAISVTLACTVDSEASH